MGFFSNIWKGVKKTFKKIGKGVKKAFKSFGKFMGKAGILGTVAMGLLTGGMGFGAMLGNFGATLAGSGSALLRGAGWVIGKAVQFGNMATSGFKTLTSGVTEFFGQAGKYIGGKLGIPGMEKMTMGQAWDGYSKALTENFSNFTSDVSSFASKSAFDMGDFNVAADASPSKSILDSSPEDYQKNVEMIGEPIEKVVKDPAPSLLGKLGESASRAVKNVGTSIEQVPGQMAGQAVISAIEGTPEYMEPMSMSYAPQVQFANVADAAARARTPMTDDQQFVQFNIPYFDGIGASNGAYSVGALHMNRLNAFTGK